MEWSEFKSWVPKGPCAEMTKLNLNLSTSNSGGRMCLEIYSVTIQRGSGLEKTCDKAKPTSSRQEGTGVLEDGLSSNGVPRSTAPGGISNPEKKTSCGTQCSNPQSLSSGTLTQKHNGLRTTEAK
ncbi:PREDICTED: brain and acute leukemia cytoplasmic protein [Myotis brandtii]|uniref:brain and acute leukemia cytoplasmic protein n=1 Tax=Myotis brandtii TaxID=109478 RepID=UPI0007047575|nr:PREDICTED: brain and acute leukemia cytoplasmic protein [Myotis brandtii]